MSLLNNVKWIGVSQLVKILAQIVTIFYLTRIISPNEYGLLAMTAIVMNLAIIFSDMGTASAVIQKQNITIGFYNLVYKINICIGILVLGVIFLCAPIVVEYFGRSELYGLLYFLSIIFPITALGIVHRAKLEKEQNFKLLAKIEIFSSTTGLVVAIIMAHLDFGVYSIVTQMVVSALLISISCRFLSGVKLSLFDSYKNEDLKHIYHFSGSLLGFNLINYFSRNLDVILIGKYFSSAVLGAYSIAYRIMLFPVQSMTFVVSRALLPHISHDLSNFDVIRYNYFNCIFIICMLTAPLMFGISALSNDFVALFFKDEWAGVTIILCWLAPSAIIQAILSTSGAVFTAFQRTNWLFLLGCVGALIYSCAFFIGAQYNIEIFAKMYFIANILNFFPVMFLVGKILKFSLKDVFLVIYKTIIPALFMFLVLYVVNLYLEKITFNNFFIKLIIGLIAYIIPLCFLNPNLAKRFLNR